MKNIVIALLVITTVLFGAYSFTQRQRAGEAEAKAAKAELEVKQRAEAEAQAAAKKDRQLKELRARANEAAATAAEKAAQAAQLEQALTAAKTNSADQQAAKLKQELTAAQGNPPGKGFADMFKSPEMKEMIKAQQKAAMGPIIDKTYAAFFQQLNLTPEQTGQLKGLIEAKMLGGADVGMALLDGTLDQAKREELTKKMKEDAEGVSAQIKQFLGDQNYPQFEAYEKSLGERMQVGTFKDQMTLAGTPLSPDQENRLIQAMGDVRQNFKFSTDFTDQSKVSANLSTFFTEEKIAQFTQEKEQMDQLSLARAQQILSPEQYEAFAKSQASQRNLQLMGMKMAAKMFAPKTEGK